MVKVERFINMNLAVTERPRMVREPEPEPTYDLAYEILHSVDGRTEQERRTEAEVLGRCALQAQFDAWEAESPNIIRGSE